MVARERPSDCVNLGTDLPGKLLNEGLTPLFPPLTTQADIRKVCPCPIHIPRPSQPYLFITIFTSFIIRSFLIKLKHVESTILYQIHFSVF